MSFTRIAFVAGLLATLLPCSTYAQKNSDEAAESQASVRREMGPTAFANPLSFEDTESARAMTGVHKVVGDSPVLFVAEIQPQKDGAVLTFTGYKECTPVAPSRESTRIIKINRQKIVAFYGCFPLLNSKDGISDHKVVYLPVSDEARAFAKKSFEKTPTVYIEMDELIIPFDTAGFARFWAAASGHAL